jgi:uncharacterized protein
MAIMGSQKLYMIQYLTIPGYGGSSSEHWQSYFEKKLSNCKRIEQKDWEKPICDDWINQIDKEVLHFKESNVILIAHSLGGIALVHWANKFRRLIKGAMIVAPADIENPYQDLSLESFIPIPQNTLSFPSVLIASSNDPWATIERSKFFSDCWGSTFINIGNAGHINVDSGHYQWDQGLDILKSWFS